MDCRGAAAAMDHPVSTGTHTFSNFSRPRCHRSESQDASRSCLETARSRSQERTEKHLIGIPGSTVSTSRHADAITPTEPLGAVAVSPSGIGLPLNSGGSASATCLFEACSAFTRVSACLFARSPKVTFTRVLQRICYLLRRPGCLRPSDRLAGGIRFLAVADFHGA